jgi:DNA-binding MarR family transcriptional regulator
MSVAGRAEVSMRAYSGSMTGAERGAWRGFVRAHALLSKELDAQLERAHGLPLSSFDVLAELSEATGRRMRMSELAAAVSLSRSGLSRLIDRLEREGLIRRTPCADDARGAYAVVTTRGIRRLEQVRPAYIQAVREDFLAHFTPADLEQLAEFWKRLLNGNGI